MHIGCYHKKKDRGRLVLQHQYMNLMHLLLTEGGLMIIIIEDINKGQQSSTPGRNTYNNFGGNKPRNSGNYRGPISYFCDHCKVNGHNK